MKLLLDQGLPHGAAVLLRLAGLDSMHVGEIGFSAAEDDEILQKARDTDRAVVTLDADFHALLALSGAAAPSVIRVRIEGLKADELSHLLQTVVAACDEDLMNGAMVTVTENRIRVRRLPLLRSVP